MTTIHASPRSQAAAAALGKSLRALVGSDAVRPAEEREGPAARWIVEPQTEAEVASVLRSADEAGYAVLPRGGGTKMGWGNAPERADLILSLLGLNRVLEHTWADMTVTVEAGCTIAALEEALARHGQRLALDPLWPDRATVGGVLSTNDTGALRHGYGGLRDMVIGVTLALADGTLAKSGGKVVKNVAGYDLPKLVTGAMGSLGVITRAIFRVRPLPAGSRTLALEPADSRAMQKILLALLQSELPCARIQARLAGDRAPVIHVEIEGSPSGLAAEEVAIGEIVRPLLPAPAPPSVWRARQELFRPAANGGYAGLAKLSVLPASLGATAASLAQLAGARRDRSDDGREARWEAVLEAIGIGWVRVEADEPAAPVAMLSALREEIERGGGSLVLLPASGAAAPFAASAAAAVDVWGAVGDAFPLMAAVKEQFDPRRTLNPGRFVGGI